MTAGSNRSLRPTPAGAGSGPSHLARTTRVVETPVSSMPRARSSSVRSSRTSCGTACASPSSSVSRSGVVWSGRASPPTTAWCRAATVSRLPVLLVSSTEPARAPTLVLKDRSARAADPAGVLTSRSATSSSSPGPCWASTTTAPAWTRLPGPVEDLYGGRTAHVDHPARGAQLGPAGRAGADDVVGSQAHPVGDRTGRAVGVDDGRGHRCADDGGLRGDRPAASRGDGAGDQGDGRHDRRAAPPAPAPGAGGMHRLSHVSMIGHHRPWTPWPEMTIRA